MTTERDAFEKAFDAYGLFRTADGYVAPVMNERWQVWKKAWQARAALTSVTSPAAVPRDAELKLMWNEAIETAACKVENMMSKPIANSVNHIAETVRGLKTVWADLPAAPPAARDAVGETRSQKMRDAGFKRRPHVKLPSDE